jgi:hypothetical protein
MGGATSLTYAPPANTTGTVYYTIIARIATGTACSGSAVASVTAIPKPGIVMTSTTIFAGQTGHTSGIVWFS